MTSLAGLVVCCRSRGWSATHCRASHWGRIAPPHATAATVCLATTKPTFPWLEPATIVPGTTEPRVPLVHFGPCDFTVCPADNDRLPWDCLLHHDFVDLLMRCFGLVFSFNTRKIKYWNKIVGWPELSPLTGICHDVSYFYFRLNRFLFLPVISVFLSSIFLPMFFTLLLPDVFLLKGIRRMSHFCPH